METADRLARHKARLVAEVPEQVFEGYLAKARDEERIRRARLFRVAFPLETPPASVNA